MKKTARTIDRATLLKNGGTAALTTLLIGALEGRADACCDPIDLTYDSSSFGPASDIASVRKYGAAAPPHGIRLVKALSASPPPRMDHWKPLFLIPNAQAAGVDENRNGHGVRGKPKPPQRLLYGIWVYTR